MKIAFCGYAPRSWSIPINQYLKQYGIEVFWITSTTSAAEFKKKQGIPKKYILDVGKYRPNKNINLEKISKLASIESSDLSINNIILMDRMLVDKNYAYSLDYLSNSQNLIENFLQTNKIEMVISLGDTALQLLTMLICKQLNIKWCMFYSIRIPVGTYGFSSSHLSSSMIALKKYGSERERLDWARSFHQVYLEKKLRPLFWFSSINLALVLYKLPIHAATLLRKIIESRFDRGNNYSRYTIHQLISKYVKRKYYAIQYNFKLDTEFDVDIDSKFFLYPLQTQPESNIDVMGGHFSDQVWLIKSICRNIPVDYSLYVKVHPGDVDGHSYSFYSQIKKIPGVKLISHKVSADLLIKNCAAVITITGTMGYEAALQGIPVITFAKNFYNSLPSVFHCGSPDLLPQIIEKAVVKKNVVTHEMIIEKLADLRMAFCCDGEFVPALHPLTGFAPAPTNSDLCSMKWAIENVFKCKQ